MYYRKRIGVRAHTSTWERVWVSLLVWRVSGGTTCRKRLCCKPFTENLCESKCRGGCLRIVVKFLLTSKRTFRWCSADQYSVVVCTAAPSLIFLKRPPSKIYARAQISVKAAVVRFPQHRVSLHRLDGSHCQVEEWLLSVAWSTVCFCKWFGIPKGAVLKISMGRRPKK